MIFRHRSLVFVSKWQQHQQQYNEHQQKHEPLSWHTIRRTRPFHMYIHVVMFQQTICGSNTFAVVVEECWFRDYKRFICGTCCSMAPKKKEFSNLGYVAGYKDGWRAKMKPEKQVLYGPTRVSFEAATEDLHLMRAAASREDVAGIVRALSFDSADVIHSPTQVRRLTTYEESA